MNIIMKNEKYLVKDGYGNSAEVWAPDWHKAAGEFVRDRKFEPFQRIYLTAQRVGEKQIFNVGVTYDPTDDGKAAFHIWNRVEDTPDNLIDLKEHCLQLMWGIGKVIDEAEKRERIYVKEALEDARAYAEEAFSKINHAEELERRGGK